MYADLEKYARTIFKKLVDTVARRVQYLVMATKRIPQADLPEYLNRKYPSARNLADAADITTQYAYDLRAGKCNPSPKVANKLGISILYEVPR